ncbi:LysR family transcriptional regulator [Azospirillum picis]|uniref:DNA-binding transcriptional LysR family regulator n=1 Tax=Azospirillum picis TaxID=488438 RepID=A0ABU0MMN7_9PROT|nr:LysR family transcriptional regulator [Azospirillum picis]MBP2300738.1 DNA-binding transcriptional LysR family regulator [Azospirillum picis]MDQ0534707.1 DNA-binding transcriptional LysR family regulator [Azospirillum picis]
MQHRDYDLASLEVFVAVAELGSMTRAAARLGLTQSAVSHVVRQLETAFAAQLLDRTIRPLALTAAGQRLWHWSNRILIDARQLPAVIGGADASFMPELRIGCIDTLAAPFIPRLLQGLRDRVPSFTIASGLCGQLREQFLARRLDVLFTNDSFDDLDQVESQRLLTEPFVLLLPRNADEVTDEAGLRALSRTVPLIRSTTDSALGKLVDQHLRRLGMEVPRSFAFDATDTVMAMVAEEMGWSLLPPTALVKSRQHLSHIRVLPLPTPGFRRSIHVVTRKGELGSLPADIHKAGRTVIRRGYFTEVLAASPWMAPMITR